MGGCCSSSRKPHLHGTPVYYYCPPALEEQESLTSHNGMASAFTTELLVGLHLKSSTPDTFRAPPVPLPYDVVFGCPPSTDSESVIETISVGSFETLATCEDVEEADCKTQSSSLIASPRQSKISKLNVFAASEEEDACPICLEEYDTENPKLITKCEHHFHLSCILEWNERSGSCPICDQMHQLCHGRSADGVDRSIFRQHTYLEVLHKSRRGDGRVVTELNFQAELEMARASEEYNRLVNRPPEVYVGKTERLKAVITIMCAAAKKCMKEKKMAPWRKYKYMQAK